MAPICTTHSHSLHVQLHSVSTIQILDPERIVIQRSTGWGLSRYAMPRWVFTPGIFHLLPLGLRVQSKLERLLDKYMGSISASRLSLATITSEELWKSSGRFDQLAPEVFKFTDRRDARYMLSPTHEEEVTALVSRTVFSYKELPLRLYQITSKFRDELRPRHGLLRSREFTMKDLYTFDISVEDALETYKLVQAAYMALFRELRLPVIMAEASSGDMGGDRSHEFHLPCEAGEDHVVSCNACGYAANEEVAQRIVARGTTDATISATTVHPRAWRGISHDRKTLITVWYSHHTPSRPEKLTRQPIVNIHTIKALIGDIGDLDASIEHPLAVWDGARVLGERVRMITLIDGSLAGYDAPGGLIDSAVGCPIESTPPEIDHTILKSSTRTTEPLQLLQVQDGDICPKCRTGPLQLQKALELGHAFYLGTRYSQPLGARLHIPTHSKKDVSLDSSRSGSLVALEMGCYGVGLSRLFGAIAEHFSDDRGLLWPSVAAPFQAIIIPGAGLEEDATQVYDAITPWADAVLDDRPVSLGWKMKDAELVGYPIVILVANTWKNSQMCEVRCRFLNRMKIVSLEHVHSATADLLAEL